MPKKCTCTVSSRATFFFCRAIGSTWRGGARQCVVNIMLATSCCYNVCAAAELWDSSCGTANELDCKAEIGEILRVHSVRKGNSPQQLLKLSLVGLHEKTALFHHGCVRVHGEGKLTRNAGACMGETNKQTNSELEWRTRSRGARVIQSWWHCVLNFFDWNWNTEIVQSLNLQAVDRRGFGGLLGLAWVVEEAAAKIFKRRPSWLTTTTVTLRLTTQQFFVIWLQQGQLTLKDATEELF